MSLFDTPFLAKLTGAIDRQKTVTVYDNQTTAVSLSAATFIDTSPYDVMTLTVEGAGAVAPDLNIRAVAFIGATNFEFLDIFSLAGKQLQPYYGSGATYASGITKAGMYIVPLTGINSIKIPLYALSSLGSVTLKINLSQSFGSAISAPIMTGRSQNVQAIYSNANKHSAYTLFSGTADSPEFFEPRTAGQRYLEHIAHSEFGIFEQVFFLRNETNATMTDFYISGDFTETRSVNRDRITNPFLTIPSIAAGESIALVSDKSESFTPGIRATLYTVPELRLPFWSFRMSYGMNPAATSGSIYLQSIQRF